MYVCMHVCMFMYEQYLSKILLIQQSIPYASTDTRVQYYIKSCMNSSTIRVQLGTCILAVRYPCTVMILLIDYFERLSLSIDRVHLIQDI